MSVSTDCASAIASKVHTEASTSRAAVPISLRVRMRMEALRFVICGAAHMTIWSARLPAKLTFHARLSHRPGVSRARGTAVAVRGRGNDLPDLGHRRRDAAHRVRPLDCGMEAGY